MTDATGAILFNIAHRKSDRKKVEIHSQLVKIHERVERTLEDIGLPSKIPCTASEIALVEEIRKRPPFLDIGEKKEHIAYQRTILDSILHYLRTCQQRKELLEEVNTILSASATSLEKDILTDQEIRQKIKETHGIHTEIVSSLNLAKETADNLKVVGDRLCMETDKLREHIKEEEEREEKARKKSILAALPLFDAETILADPQCRKAAAREIKNILDDSVAAMKTNHNKARVRNAIKQFAFVCSALEIRNRELFNKGEDIIRLNLKMGQQAKAHERLQRNNNQVAVYYDIRLIC